jgi:hypothetical protein
MIVKNLFYELTILLKKYANMFLLFLLILLIFLNKKSMHALVTQNLPHNGQWQTQNTIRLRGKFKWGHLILNIFLVRA